MSYSFDYYDIFLLPRNEQELTRAGLLLYLIGLFCTFLFFGQFNILSIDMLKPQCILIGLYVWLYAVLIPRVILIICTFIKPRLLSKIFVFIIFLTFLSVINFILSDGYFIYRLLTSYLIFIFYYYDIFSFKWYLAPKAICNYLFIPIISLYFSLNLIGTIPFALGGTKPANVIITWKKDDLLKSRFVKNYGHYNLLYESSSDYYFLQTRKDNNTNEIYGYIVNRVAKTEILKIQFTTDIWLTF